MGTAWAKTIWSLTSSSFSQNSGSNGSHSKKILLLPVQASLWCVCYAITAFKRICEKKTFPKYIHRMISNRSRILNFKQVKIVNLYQWQGLFTTHNKKSYCIHTTCQKLRLSVEFSHHMKDRREKNETETIFNYNQTKINRTRPEVC